MKCIQDAVIPPHISGDDANRILERILKNNATQVQVDGLGNTFINLYSSKESLVNQVKDACIALDIEYDVKPCSEQRCVSEDAKFNDMVTYIETYKTVYKMTDEEKLTTINKAMGGWAGSPKGVLMFCPVDHVSNLSED